MAERDYTIVAPDGREFTITGPDNATPEQLRSAAARAFDALPAVKREAKPTAQSESYKEGRQAPGAVRGLSNVLQGPTFGFADEIGGAIGGAIDALKGKDRFSDAYTKNRDYLRGASDEVKDATPIFSLVTQGMASAPMLLLNPTASVAPRATGMLANSLRAGASGAATGALSGAGTSTSDNALGVAKDAAISGATGGALSAAAVPVAGVLGAGVGAVRQRVSQNAAAEAARAKIAEAISRDARGNTFRQGYAGNPTDQAAARYSKLGDEARVVDAGGQNTRQLLDTVATLPGRSKEDVERAIRARQASRGGRMIDAADEALGANGRRQAETIDSLMQQRQQAAAPLYERLYRASVPVDNELQTIVSAAEQLGATRLGRDIATGRRIPYSLDEANASASGSYRMADLDHLKQALDTQIMTKGTDRGTGRLTPLGVSLDRLRQSLVSHLDDATGGAYRQARDAFAGPTAVMDAMNSGRNALQRDDAAIGAVTRGMSASELEGFRLGAFEALRAKMGGRAGQTQIMEMWREPATQEKLRAIFGNERAYREFASSVAAEARLKGLETVGRGSQTAARQFAAGDIDTIPMAEAATAAKSLMSGNALGVLGPAKNAWNRVRTPEPVRDAMGNILLSSGDRGYRNLLSLSDLVDQINNAKAMNANRIGTVGGAVGNALAPVLAPR